MAEYIVRIIGYGLLLFVNGMIYYFLHSQFYFLVLVLMVAGPILSAMSVWVLRHYLQVEIHHAQDSYGVQGETAYFTIQIKNPTWFVSLDTKLIVNVENTLMETIGQQVFSVPVHAGKGYTLTLPVVATYPGLLKISVSRVYIKDLMGFFRLKKNVEQTAELSILPRAVTDIAYEKTALEQGMLESEESSKRGNDFSDVQEVREYIPGDKLMSIHWKLSAKTDELLVKELSLPVGSREYVGSPACDRAGAFYRSTGESGGDSDDDVFRDSGTDTGADDRAAFVLEYKPL